MKINDAAVIKEFCYIVLAFAVLGLTWLFFVGFPALAEKAVGAGLP